jgi:adenylyltransferase/sulfurtransferase
VEAINSGVRVKAQVASLDRRNVRDLLAGAELVFDGLDSYATRFILNDYALATDTPYFYAGVVRGELSAHAVVPGRTSCLRCLLAAPPAAGETPTCAAEGVYPPLLGLANLLQLRAADAFLAGGPAAVEDVLWTFDLASMQLRRLPLPGPSADCPACRGRYDYLDGLAGPDPAAACAPDRVEMESCGPPLSLAAVEARLAASRAFALRRNAWCLTAEAEGRRYTIFASGRLVLSGGQVQDLERFAATYLGV